jgi:Cft2 family RNA processing exonuclease
MQLTFCGGAGRVTGSCFLFPSGATRFLVDCGMFQGPCETCVDSPMATEVTRITASHFELFDDEARRTADEAAASGESLRVSYTASVEESKALNRLTGGAIIVAASGMCDGGRIRHHLLQRLPDPRTTVLFKGCRPWSDRDAVTSPCDTLPRARRAA